jgi:hypothetical protein
MVALSLRRRSAVALISAAALAITLTAWRAPASATAHAGALVTGVLYQNPSLRSADGSPTSSGG